MAFWSWSFYWDDKRHSFAGFVSLGFPRWDSNPRSIITSLANVTCVDLKLNIPLPDANLVVLAAEVLDPLEVERLDDALATEVELGAARRRLDGRGVVAVDLSDPEAFKKSIYARK